MVSRQIASNGGSSKPVKDKGVPTDSKCSMHFGPCVDAFFYFYSWKESLP